MTSTRNRDIARSILVVLGLTLAVAMLGPFQDLEHDLVPWDKAGHFLAFYVATALIYVAFPTRRRFDLSCLMALIGVGSEIAQYLVGRDCAFGDVLADCCGAFALYLPVLLDDLRRPAQLERRKSRKPAPVAQALEA